MPKSTTNKTIEQERGAGPRRPRPFFKAAHIEPLNRGRTVGRSTSGRAFVCPRRRRRFCSRPLSFCGKLRKRHTGPHRRFYKVGPFRMLDSLRRSEPQKPPIFRHDFFVVACLLAGKSQRGALEKFKAGFSRNNCAAQIMPGSFPSKNTAIFPPLAAWQPGQPAPPGHIENRTRSNRTGTATAGPCLLSFRYRKPGDELRKPQGPPVSLFPGTRSKNSKPTFRTGKGRTGDSRGSFRSKNAGI